MPVQLDAASDQGQPFPEQHVQRVEPRLLNRVVAGEAPQHRTFPGESPQRAVVGGKVSGLPEKQVAPLPRLRVGHKGQGTLDGLEHPVGMRHPSAALEGA